MEKCQNDYSDYLKASGIQLRVVFIYFIVRGGMNLKPGHDGSNDLKIIAPVGIGGPENRRF